MKKVKTHLKLEHSKLLCVDSTSKQYLQLNRNTLHNSKTHRQRFGAWLGVGLRTID